MSSSRLAAPRYAATRAHIAAIRAWAAPLGEADRSRIDAALDLMIELHLDQADRPGPQPYVEHTAEVAHHVIAWTEPTSPDAVIAACLHDAVEDQARRLAGRSDRPDGETRALALSTVARRFGPRVATLIDAVTNPDIDALVTTHHGAIEGEAREARKREIYAEHVIEVLDGDPEAAAIKLGDFGSNALRLDRIDTSSAEGQERKAKLLRKYARPMRHLLTYFESLPASHPLHAKRDALHERVHAAWLAEYAGRVEAE